MLLSICFLLPMLSVLGLGKEAGMSESLSLTIRTNNDTFSLGETVEIVYCLKNNSKNPITVLKWEGAPYPTRKLKFIGPDGKELKSVRTVFYDITMFLPRDHYVTLKSGEDFCMNFSAVLDLATAEEMEQIGSQKPVLRFPECYIPLNDFETFKVVGRYEISERLRIEGEQRYSIDNIWTGKLFSGGTAIKINKEKPKPGVVSPGATL